MEIIVGVLGVTSNELYTLLAFRYLFSAKYLLVIVTI